MMVEQYPWTWLVYPMVHGSGMSSEISRAKDMSLPICEDLIF